MASRTWNNRALALSLVGLIAGMVCLAYASVPLYKLFCQITGFGGTTQAAEAAPGAELGARKIIVEFDSNVNKALPWRFKPEQRRVKLAVGEERLVSYRAENISEHTITGTATFNVTPFKAGPYFSKIECFCFTEQTLAPGEVVSMPVSFFVDPDIQNDPNMRDVTTITLSYTFFDANEDSTAYLDIDPTEFNDADRGAL